MPLSGMCAVVPTPQGGAYMPPFGMCAAIAHRGPCPHCTSLADITRRRLRHPGKLMEESERRKSRRVSGKRDPALAQKRHCCARNDTGWLGMTSARSCRTRPLLLFFLSGLLRWRIRNPRQATAWVDWLVGGTFRGRRLMGYHNFSRGFQGEFNGLR